MDAQAEDKSIRDLVSDLTTKSNDLVRKEVALAKLEITEALDALKVAIPVLALGGVVAFGGFLVLLAALVIWVDSFVINPALSAFIVGALVLSIGAIMLLTALRRMSGEKIGPHKIVPSLREDANLVRRHI